MLILERSIHQTKILEHFYGISWDLEFKSFFIQITFFRQLFFSNQCSYSFFVRFGALLYFQSFSFHLFIFQSLWNGASKIFGSHFIDVSFSWILSVLFSFSISVLVIVQIVVTSSVSLNSVACLVTVNVQIVDSTVNFQRACIIVQYFSF